MYFYNTLQSQFLTILAISESFLNRIQTSYFYFFHKNSVSQNLNWCLATSPYSALLNLYFKVEMNLGLISIQKDLTSLMTSESDSSVQPENCSISLFQQFIFFNYLLAKIIEAAAICDYLNFRREASKSWISCKYWAQKKTSSSLSATLILLNLCKNLQADGLVSLKLRAWRMSFSICKTVCFVNLFSLTARKSLSSGGQISSYLEAKNKVETPSK